MNMEKKEIKITIPKGYKIDKENSTFEKIVFKKVKEEPKRWRDDGIQLFNGYFIGTSSDILIADCVFNSKTNRNVFATKKQAKSALAMARISQIMDNDERFGDIVNDEEWENDNLTKHVINRYGKQIGSESWNTKYHFLAFHTKEQRDLFLEENMDLIKDYLMIE